MATSRVRFWDAVNLKLFVFKPKLSTYWQQPSKMIFNFCVCSSSFCQVLTLSLSVHCLKLIAWCHHVDQRFYCIVLFVDCLYAARQLAILQPHSCWFLQINCSSGIHPFSCVINTLNNQVQLVPNLWVGYQRQYRISTDPVSLSVISPGYFHQCLLCLWRDRLRVDLESRPEAGVLQWPRNVPFWAQ